MNIERRTLNKEYRTMNKAEIPIVILAGGRGTRLMEETRVMPKPMVTIGGKPILLHIMLYYSAFGFKRFVICLGYKGYLIKEYFENIHKHTSSMRIMTRSQQITFESTEVQDWDISLVETGENSLTATRIRMVKNYLDASVFGLTYGDGVTDIDLDKELQFHMEHEKMGTMAAVHPPARFGLMDIEEGGLVSSFREKEKLHHDYINGGFFFFNSNFIDRLPIERNLSLEAEPLTSLAEDRQLYAFQHEGFWKCMDTLRDREELETIYDAGSAPWVM